MGSSCSEALGGMGSHTQPWVLDPLRFLGMQGLQDQAHGSSLYPCSQDVRSPVGPTSRERSCPLPPAQASTVWDLWFSHSFFLLLPFMSASSLGKFLFILYFCVF